MPWKDEIIIIYRPLQADRLGDIVYVLALTAPAEQFEKEDPYLNKVLEGFQLTDLPRGPCTNDR
jgi:hypothetical protein